MTSKKIEKASNHRDLNWISSWFSHGGVNLLRLPWFSTAIKAQSKGFENTKFRPEFTQQNAKKAI